MKNDQNYTELILKEMRGDIKAILEVVVPMQEKVNRIPKIEDDVIEIKDDIRTIKTVLETNAA